MRMIKVSRPWHDTILVLMTKNFIQEILMRGGHITTSLFVTINVINGYRVSSLNDLQLDVQCAPNITAFMYTVVTCW